MNAAGVGDAPAPMSSPEGDVDDGLLLLAATPIGDSRDASPRLLQVLEDADVIAAEDTRRLRRLCAALQIRPGGEIVSYHDHNEHSRTSTLAAQVAAGRTVLLVTDAGMPSVSDPGFRLVAAVAADGGRVSCVPGPSAVLAALAVSGLACDRFCFEGFLPRKAGERDRMLGGLTQEPRTMVFFEAPHRLTATLAAMSAQFGSTRPAAVCRELTKIHEQVVRGSLTEVEQWALSCPEQVRGEITIVVAGAAPTAPDPDSAAQQVRERVAAGQRLKEACREVAAATGVSSRVLYAAVTADPAGSR